MNRKLLISIFIIIPLAVGCMLGYEMGFKRIEAVPTVILDQDKSDFSMTLTDYIAENNSFSVRHSVGTVDEIKEMLLDGDAAIGVIFPADMYEKLRKGQSPDVLVLYDGTKLHLMAFSKAKMNEILMTAQAGYMKKYYEGKLGIVPAESIDYAMPLNVSYDVLFNRARSMSNFLLPGMLAAVIQVGMAIVGVEAAQGHKRNFADAVKRIAVYGSMGALSLILCLWIQYAFFGMPYVGTLAGGLLISFLFALCITTFGYFIGALMRDRVLGTQIACVLVLPTSLLGGYTFPIMAMPAPFAVLAKIMPYAWYSDAIRNLTLMEMDIGHLKRPLFYLIAMLAAEAALLFILTEGRRKYGRQTA